MIYHPEVEPELVRAGLYYEGQRDGLGLRFLGDFERTISEIRERPMAWPALGTQLRRHQFRHFPFAIIYRVLPDAIRVLAIMHLHQHPDYWKARR